MEIWFWKNFVKRENSTLVPAAAPTKKYTDVTIQAPCDEANPVIIIGEQKAYDYCYIPYWGRYYHITNNVYSGKYTEIHMTVDVLASFRSQILDSTQYVLRSASAYNGSLSDGLYPTSTSVTTKYNFTPAWQTGGKNNPFVSSLSKGVYIVGIVNDDDSAIGAISYYAMTDKQFHTFKGALMNTTGWANDAGMEITSDLLKVFLNPFEYVVSVKWFPFDALFVPLATASYQGQYAWWVLPFTGNTVLAGTYTDISYNWNLSDHPQAHDRGKYLNCEPYTKTMIDWPAIGTIAVDSTLIADDPHIHCSIRVDLITGTAIVKLNTPSYNFSRTITVDIGVPIILSKVDSLAGSAAGVMAGAAQVGTSVATGNAGGAAAGVGGIMSSIATMVPHPETISQNGSVTKFSYPPILVQNFYHQTDMDNIHKGRPLCENRKLSGLKGYTLCENASLPVAGTLGEKQKIESYLNGGFYIE